MNLDLYIQSGEKKGTVEVSDALFKAPIKEELMRLALVRQKAHERQGNATTLTKAEVRGGGKKPWRQKGTGRARAGSIRSPLWRGGGIIFGPTNERNYLQRMNKKARRAALFSSLSQKAADQGIFVLETFSPEKPKTKIFADLMKKLPVKRSLLVVAPQKDDSLEKSTRNLPRVKTILVNYLNIFDILKYEKVMFLEPSLKKAEELFLKN